MKQKTDLITLLMKQMWSLPLLKSMRNKELAGQVLRFGIVGVANTLNYYVLYLLFFYAFSLSYMASHLLAFVISMVGSFYLNCFFTYRVRPTLKKFFQFPITYVVNVTVSSLALFILVDFLHFNETISPLIAQGLTIPATFIISKKVLVNKNTTR